MTNKAVVLLSGGLDSATALAVAKKEEFQPYTLSFDYDQRHRYELECARKVSKNLGAIDHKIVRISTFGGSALNDLNLEVPTGRSVDQMTESIGITYVPGRNTIFLGHALSYAEVLDADSIFIGVNAVDYSGYPDCRPEYITAFQNLADLATRKTVEGRSIKIRAPLIKSTKVDIVKLGIELGVDYSLTSSCYNPDKHGHACGKCDSCLIRMNAFYEAGIQDPTIYSHKKGQAALEYKDGKLVNVKHRPGDKIELDVAYYAEGNFNLE